MFDDPNKDSWAKLDDTNFKDGTFSFVQGSSIFDAKFVRSVKESNCLIVWFHAAINRDKYKVPIYFGFNNLFTAHAHQLSIADPTLSLHKELRAGWYIGAENYSVQTELKELIKNIKDALGIQRTLYIGGSAGGFACMYYSFHDTDSCAIALQPQISLGLSGYRGRYLELCWSNRELSDISESVCCDIGNLYKDDFNNSVIYLQSTADAEHVNLHMPLFHTAIKNRVKGQAIFHVDFWGELGHVNIPKPVVNTWIMAALTSRTLKADDILMTRHALTLQAECLATKVQSDRIYSEADMAMADLLYEMQLSSLSY